MPILKKYSEGYHKNGYFVHAPIEGLSHPLPLQTPEITARIYKELGYDEGDHVPNELTWKLYDVNLHWTENTGTDTLSQDELESAVLEESGPEFTTEETETIISVVESYHGDYESEVRDLVDELDADRDLNRMPDSGDGDSVDDTVVDVEQILNQSTDESGIERFEETIDRELTDDEIELVKETTTPETIDEIDGVTFGANEIESTVEYYERLARCENVLSSLTDFYYASPLEVQRVVPIPPSVGYFYDVDTPGVDGDPYGSLRHLVISDKRYNENAEEDLVVTITKNGISVRFQVCGDHITDYSVRVPDQELGHLEREAVEDGVSGDLTPDQLMHHGLGTVIDCVEVLEDLLEHIPEYRFCPVKSFSST